MSLKQPLNPLKYEQSNDLFDDAYAVFQVELNFRDNRPTLFGKRIFIDATSQIDNKIIGFWHMASIGADDSKFDMFPCSNDEAIGRCVFLCNADHSENFLKHMNSTPCIYRASRVGWVRQIIEIAGSREESYLTVWTHDDNRGQKCLHLRYRSGLIDYIVIFLRVKSFRHDN